MYLYIIIYIMIPLSNTTFDYVLILRKILNVSPFRFAGDMEILAYFFGPVGALLAINLLFFAVTARELTCGLWKGEFVKSTTER